MWFPTVADVLEVHDRVQRFTAAAAPVLPGLLNPGAVHAAVERARWGPFGHGGDLAERAALLFRGIVQDHPFLDGNKRTGFEVCDLFVGMDGYRLIASKEAIVQVTLGLAKGQLGVTEVRAWIRTHQRER